MLQNTFGCDVDQNGTLTHLGIIYGHWTCATLHHKVLSSLSHPTTTAPALLLATHPRRSQQGHHWIPHHQASHLQFPNSSLPCFTVYLTIKSPLSLAPKTAFIILLLCSFVKKNSHCQPFFFSLMLTSGSPSPTDCSPIQGLFPISITASLWLQDF